MARTKVVVVGGGFGGLNVAKSLGKADIDVLILDQTNHHLFQPLLYQVATAAISPGEIGIPIREIVRKQENTTVFMEEVVAIDKDLKQLVLKTEERIGYDYLVLAVGARHSYFGKDQWEQYAPGLKTIDDALTIREKVLTSFEIAETLDTPEETKKYLNFAIIGGGPTGVEMAGAIAEIARHTLFKNFRKIKPEESQIYLIEATSRILPVYPEKLSLRAKKDLEKMGVQVLLGQKVLDIKEGLVVMEDRTIECHNIIWAAGNQASPILKTLGVPLDRQGRVIVEKDLSIPGHPEIFVIGDAAVALGDDGKPLPGIAPTAIQQAKYVGNILKNAIPKASRPPFHYFDKGYMATIGRGKAVAVVRQFYFAGIFAWLAWCFIHILYLIGFRNRLTVFINWIYLFISNQRGVRLIYKTRNSDR